MVSHFLWLLSDAPSYVLGYLVEFLEALVLVEILCHEFLEVFLRDTTLDRCGATLLTSIHRSLAWRYLFRMALPAVRLSPMASSCSGSSAQGLTSARRSGFLQDALDAGSMEN